MDHPNRRHILMASTALAVAAITPRALADDPAPAKPKRPEKGPPIPSEDVRAFVGAGHGDPEAVRTMLAQRPTIVNATWDWGGGDFETALGGAAHMGRRDIALQLLKAGARIDLFAAAMLGYLEIVQAAVRADPDVVSVKGPHGITLIEHAERGKEQSIAVLEYLRALKSPG